TRDEQRGHCHDGRPVLQAVGLALCDSGRAGCLFPSLLRLALAERRRDFRGARRGIRLAIGAAIRAPLSKARPEVVSGLVPPPPGTYPEAMRIMRSRFLFVLLFLFALTALRWV